MAPIQTLLSLLALFTPFRSPEPHLRESEYFPDVGYTARKIVLTNDDGWAVANIHANYYALQNAGYDVVLSAPAENQSGTGSSSAPPTILTRPCEFNSCPVGSPPEGFNASNPRINYVNSYPVDAVRYGIQTRGPYFFDGTKPDFVVSGFNVGSNLGNRTLHESGTVGAACEAALQGIPSTSFSGATGAQISYETLFTKPTSRLSHAARVYADLTVKYLDVLFSAESDFGAGRGGEDEDEMVGTILPPGVSVNVNFPVIRTAGNCSKVADFIFVLTTVVPGEGSTSVDELRTCAGHCDSINRKDSAEAVPDETSVVTGPGCFVSVSVINASTKTDVDVETREWVAEKLKSLLGSYS